MTSLRSSVGNCFKIFCVMVLICLICYQIYIFIQNKDMSITNYKEFDNDDESYYPAISACLHSSTGKIINKNNPLIQNIEGGVDTYHQSLLGIKDASKNISFDDVTRHLFKDFISVFFTMSRDGEVLSSWDSSSKEKKYRSGKTIEVPFFRSYQDPYFLCMSKKINIRKNQIINLESLSLISSSLLSSGIEHLLVYIHEPGHLVQQFGKQVLQLSITDFEYATKRTNNKYDISINHVDVLRKRNKPEKPCNEQLKNEDSLWRSKIIENVGCIPSYWANLENHVPEAEIFHHDLEICNLKTEYEKLATIYLPPKHMKNGRQLYTGSCNYMEIISSVSKSDSPDDDLLLAINYKTESFRETINVRAIGFMNLISAIGGFIGLLIGFGLFQVIEIA